MLYDEWINGGEEEARLEGEIADAEALEEAAAELVEDGWELAAARRWLQAGCPKYVPAA